MLQTATGRYLTCPGIPGSWQVLGMVGAAEGAAMTLLAGLHGHGPCFAVTPVLGTGWEGAGTCQTGEPISAQSDCVA